MSKQPVASLSDDDLLDTFVACAHQWGKFSEAGSIPKVNRLVKQLVTLTRELESRDPAVRLRLAPLLDSRDPGVRFQAGYELLALLPDRARAAIESIGQAGLYGLSGRAKMFLSAVDDCEYVPK